MGALSSPSALLEHLGVHCRASEDSMHRCVRCSQNLAAALTDSKIASSSSFVVSVRPCFCSMSCISNRQL